MKLIIRVSAAIPFVAFFALCGAEAQDSPNADVLRALRDQIEMLSDRMNESPERERVREMEEHIRMLERQLEERAERPRERERIQDLEEHIRAMEEHIQMLERELQERAEHPPERGHIRELENHIRTLEREFGEGRRVPRGASRGPGRLPGSVTLVFSGGGVESTVTTAMPMYQLEGQHSEESHEIGESQQHEEIMFRAKGRVEVDARSGSIFVSCEGAFIYEEISSEEGESAAREGANIEFHASVLLQSGEEKVIASQGGHTLTVKATFQPFAPPRRAPPDRRR